MKEYELSNEQMRVILAINLCASTEEARYYLQGVYIDSEAKRIVATDGHMMLWHEADIYAGMPSMIVPSALLNRVKVDKKSLGFVLRSDGEALQLEDIANKVVYKDRAIDGTFPYYARVIPEYKDARPFTAFSAKLLKRFDAITRKAGAEHKVIFDYITNDGPSAGRMTLEGAGYLHWVLMPMRHTDFIPHESEGGVNVAA